MRDDYMLSTVLTNRTASDPPPTALQDEVQDLERKTNRRPQTPALRIGGTTIFHHSVGWNQTSREGTLVGSRARTRSNSTDKLRESVQLIHVLSVPVLEV